MDDGCERHRPCSESDLPVADFWGRRVFEETLRQEELERWQERMKHGVPARQKMQTALTDYFDGQVGFLEHVVTPMFQAYSTFTSTAFRDEVLDSAATNATAWREGLGAARRMRDHMEAQGSMREKLVKTSVFCTLLSVWSFTRCKLIGDKYMGRHSEHTGTSAWRHSSTSVAEAVTQVRVEFLVFSFAMLLLAAACMAWVSLSASMATRTSPRHGERLMRLVSVAFVMLRSYIIYRRHTLTKTLSDHGVNSSFPFLREAAFSSPTSQALLMSILPVIISVAFYGLVPHYSARVHVFWHSFVPLCSGVCCHLFLASDHRKRMYAGGAVHSEEMVGRVEMTWAAHILFPIVLCVLGSGLRDNFPPWGLPKKQLSSFFVVLSTGVGMHYLCYS
jgi:hypothetical protein